MRWSIAVVLASVVGLCSAVPVGAQKAKDKPTDKSKGLEPARAKALDWLTKNQAKDGSWGKTYTVAITAFGCLAYLSASDEPFIDDHGKALHKGLKFLLAQHKDGVFTPQGHSWIHGQGFATLALAEAYGRSLFCKTKPDMDMKKLRAVIVDAVKHIQTHQSNSGGWWYTMGNKGDAEGSTTVCAVQAIVAADNFGIPIDEKVLDKGFEYLKKSQTSEGGFNYKLGDGTNMKAGTAGDIATLGLMKQFDTGVMLKGYKFLQTHGPAALINDNFPFYGQFYGVMGMHLLGQEFKEDKKFREETGKFIDGLHTDILAKQAADGSVPLRGWVASSGEGLGYSTAFSLLTLSVPEARLSIYNRKAPKLPKGATGN